MPSTTRPARRARRARCILVYVTCPTPACARKLAEAAVDERLAACANILGGMQSVYRWKGTIERARETVLLLKTRAALGPKLTARLRALHPYECPCIVFLPIEGGHGPFLNWIADETAP